MLNLQEKYKKEVIPAMMKQFGYKNPMAVPMIKKVVVNTGFGRQVAEKSGEEQKRIENATMNDLSLICGQKPVFKKAKKSIAAFKLRQGLNIGTACTLRRKRMYDFLDRLIHVVLPRSRDFRGIDSKAFDEAGNLTIGMKEHIAFPEILSEKAKSIFGLEITIATNAKNKEKGIGLLKLMGFPIKSTDK
ncbi:MAG: 50S ribosomal protein L5 [bacterium]|nr:50S ribosomal protein L5 [bacterium]